MAEISFAAGRRAKKPLALALAGLAALLLGIGLSRFAFTPLIPALIGAGWFSTSQAGYLGATNLAGYLIGAALARRLAEHLPPMGLVKISMLIGMASFAACALDWGFAWYAAWRLASGVIGGVLMILAPAAVLAATPPERRGRIGGIVFTGVGAGIALSGGVIPSLVGFGLPAAWLALAGVAAVLTLCAWPVWPDSKPLRHEAAPREPLRITLPLALLIVSYTLGGLAFAPHTVFWANYIARGLGLGLHAGGLFWLLLGLGAASGPLLTGFVAERLGFARSYALTLLLFGLSIGVPVVSASQAALALSSFGTGAFGIAVTALGSGRAGELAPMHHYRQLWGWMTIGFAVVYALGGYGYTYLLAQTGSYPLVFGLGAAAALLGCLCAAVKAR